MPPPSVEYSVRSFHFVDTLEGVLNKHLTDMVADGFVLFAIAANPSDIVVVMERKS